MEHNKSNEKQAAIKAVAGKPFFLFDAIDYYVSDYDEAKIGELYDNQSRSKTDSFKMGILIGDIPDSSTDGAFIAMLEQVGYRKEVMASAKFKEIDGIFMEKQTSENLATACIPVYRDILVFKKEGKVTGVAKICFSCGAYQIKGTTAHTANFGQDGDYGKLERILRP